MRYNALIIFTSLFTAGCTDSDISLIKDGRLNDFPEFTIGQAFDSRNVCESTHWRTFVDDRKRTVVEYQCALKDATGYYVEETQKQLDSAILEKERIKNYYEDKIQEREEYIPRRREEMQGSFHPSAIEKMANIEKGVLKNLRENYEKKTISASLEIETLQQQLDSLEEISAQEYFHWTTLEDGEFMIIAAGITEKTPDGIYSESIYNGFGGPLSALYSNEADTYSHYIKQIDATGDRLIID